MTRELRDAIKDGYSEEYLRLLYNFGIWSRYFGCTGFKSFSRSSVCSVITDETAAEVDKAVAVLKRHKPDIYTVFRMYYIQSLNEVAILHRLRIEKQELKSLRYVSSYAIRDLIQYAERYILNVLLGGENEDSEI